MATTLWGTAIMLAGVLAFLRANRLAGRGRHRPAGVWAGLGAAAIALDLVVWAGLGDNGLDRAAALTGLAFSMIGGLTVAFCARRPAKGAPVRTPPRRPPPPSAGRGRGITSSLRRLAAAGPLAGAGALGLALVLAFKAPLDEVERLVAAGLALPVAWALGMIAATARPQKTGLPKENKNRRLNALRSSHAVLGLAGAALIHLICLSGSLSVLVDDFKAWEAPRPLAASLTPAALDRLLETVMASSPGSIDAFYVHWPAADQAAGIDIYDRTGEHRLLVRTDGPGEPATTPWTDFLTGLHMTLLLPAPWGSALVGLAGAALLAILFSGLFSHRRIFRDAFTLRLDASPRLALADLHNRLGTWGLPFHLTIAVTGAFFGLGSLVLLAIGQVGFDGDMARAAAPLAGPTVRADATPAPLPCLAAMLKAVREVRPTGQVVMLGASRPLTRGQSFFVEMSIPGRLPRADRFFFDGEGQPLGSRLFATGGIGLQIYAAAAQLHFGFFGGLAIRVLYALLGAALVWLTASGVSVWLARRAGQGRPAPRLAGLWTAWTWGCPVAFGVAAILSPWLPAAPVFWTSLTLSLAMAAWRFDAAASAAKAGLAIILSATGLLHLASKPVVAVGLTIDGILILSGLLLAGGLYTRRRPNGLTK